MRRYQPTGGELSPSRRPSRPASESPLTGDAGEIGFVAGSRSISDSGSEGDYGSQAGVLPLPGAQPPRRGLISSLPATGGSGRRLSGGSQGSMTGSETLRLLAADRPAMDRLPSRSIARGRPTDLVIHTGTAVGAAVAAAEEKEIPAEGKDRYMLPAGHPLAQALSLIPMAVGWCLFLFLVGGVAAALRHAGVPAAHLPYAVLLFPVWLGDAAALFFLMLLSLHTISWRFRQGQGLKKWQVSGPGSFCGSNDAIYGTTGPGGGVGGSEVPKDDPPMSRWLPRGLFAEVVLDSALMPFVWRMHASLTVAVAVLAIVFAWQVLLCLRLETGSPGALATSSPLVLIEAGGLAAAVLLNVGWQTVGFWILVLALTLSVGLRQDDIPPFAGAPWFTVLTPLWGLNLLFLLSALYITANVLVRRYFCTTRQNFCLACYLLGLVLAWLGELMLSFPPVAEITPRAKIFRVHLPLIFLMAGATMACVAVYLSVVGGINRFIKEQNFPGVTAVLSVTRWGWERSGGGYTTWPLLGDIAKAGGRGGLTALVVEARGGGRSYGRSINSSTSSPERSGGVGGVERGGGGFQRTDSGSYDNPDW
ncbi:unnamed protein product [Phaeothamnion confervicola]